MKGIIGVKIEFLPSHPQQSIRAKIENLHLRLLVFGQNLQEPFPQIVSQQACIAYYTVNYGNAAPNGHIPVIAFDHQFLLAKIYECTEVPTQGSIPHKCTKSG